MKRCIVMMLLVLSGFILSSCNYKNIEGNDKIIASPSYEIEKESYVDKNIKINYPQIINFSDQEKQKRLNAIIRDNAYGYLENYSEEEKSKFEMKIDYRIGLKNSRILSVQYFGDEYDIGANHPNSTFYTTNIDIPNEKLIRLTDIVNINEDFVLKFRNGKLVSPENKQKDIIFSPPFDNSNEEWINRFNNADAKESQDYSYLTENSLGISVPIAHALGDHAEFEIKYQDLKDNIKTENEIWNDLLQGNNKK